MKKQGLMLLCALMLMAAPLAAQTGSGSGSGSGSNSASSNSTQATTTTKDGKTATTTVKTEDQNAPRIGRITSNVQIELTLTDQVGSGTAEKKTVSMIVSAGSWGKIRSAATAYPIGEPPYPVELNVDARPNIYPTAESQVTLELTFVYAPVKNTGDPKDISSRQRPSGINQSQTVILQSGKPLVVSQAADPLSDRKVVIEVKATVLK